MKIVIAVQCKLARTMFALCKYRKYYDPEKVEESIFVSEIA
jgi:hypothetical protein